MTAFCTRQNRRRLLFVWIAVMLFAVAGLFPQTESPVPHVSGPGNLVSPEVWAYMRRAEFCLDEGDSGGALSLVEKARAMHQEETSRMAESLRAAAGLREIRRAGDSISAVRPVLLAREDFAVAEMLDCAVARRPDDLPPDSFSALLAWVEQAAVFPEADVFTGRVYEAEGEYGMALSFYERAWETRQFFDVPEDRITLAYRMADLAGFSGNPGARENYLLLALTGDPVFGTPGNESAALLAMMRTAQEDRTGDGAPSGVAGASGSLSPAFVKFFSLYRNDNPFALKAYRELADFYLESGRLDRAFPAAVLSAVTAFTLLENAVREYEFEYAYVSFSDTLRLAAAHGEITRWASGILLWDSFVQFGAVLFAAGERDFAMSLWMNVSLYCPDRTASEKAAAWINRSVREPY